MRRFALLLLLSLPVCAENLDSLIRTALENNPDLARYDRLIEAGATEESLSGKLDNPKLQGGINDVLANDPYARDREPMQTQSLMLSQSLPLSSRLAAAENVAQAKTALAKLEKDEATVRLVYEVKTTAYGITKLQNDLQLIARYTKLLNELIRIHTLYNIESKTHYQMTLKSSIMKKGIELKKSRTQNRIEELRGRLRALVGSDFGSVDTVLSLLSIPSLDSMLSRAGENFSLRVAKQRTAVAKEEVRLTERRAVPDLTVSVGYFQREAFEDYYALNLSLPLPVYGKEEKQIQKSRVLADSKQAAQSDLQNRIEAEIKKAYYGMRNAQEEYELLQEIVKEQKELVDSLTKKIESKQSSLREGYEVIKEMLDSEFSVNEALYRFNMQHAYTSMLRGEK